MTDSEKLLTEEEQGTCQKIAASGEGLAGQRAAALLAIDQGATHAQASEQTGLTVSQVGYLLRAFRKKHLSMFPDTELLEEEEEEEVKASEPEEAKKAKAKKAKKGKKDKKGKDKMKAKKKDKEPKKDKKDKDMSKAKKKDKEPKKGKKDKAKKDQAAKKKSKKE